MDVTERIVEFINKAGVFYYATCDGDQARVRPFGFCASMNGKLYFGMGNHKRSYAQTVKNPHVEVCARNGDEWIRVSGKAVFDWDPKTEAEIFKNNPFLEDKYGPKTNLTHAAFYLEDLRCEYYTFSMPDNTYELWT